MIFTNTGKALFGAAFLDLIKPLPTGNRVIPGAYRTVDNALLWILRIYIYKYLMVAEHALQAFEGLVS